MSILTSTLVLRLVDNKAILYFDAPSPSDALNWFRGKYNYTPRVLFWLTVYPAINLHIPSAKA